MTFNLEKEKNKKTKMNFETISTHT